jgi:hypothetical protein
MWSSQPFFPNVSYRSSLACYFGDQKYIEKDFSIACLLAVGKLVFNMEMGKAAHYFIEAVKTSLHLFHQ